MRFLPLLIAAPLAAHPADLYAIHNGADDQASGVAALFAIAERLQADDAPKSRNYLFLAFSGEELGLYGSALSAGLYVVRLTGETISQTRSLAVAR